MDYHYGGSGGNDDIWRSDDGRPSIYLSGGPGVRYSYSCATMKKIKLIKLVL